MITPEEALRRVLQHAHPLSPRTLDIHHAHGMTLAKEVKCQDNLPRFDQSAMDGYAIRYQDIAKASPGRPVFLKLIGEIQAGSQSYPKLQKGCAIQISTGARIPPGSDTVIMQENCKIQESVIAIHGAEDLEANIRYRGEEIQKGKIALSKGSRLNPGSLAWLASMGIQKISVYPQPRIGLLRSGNELIDGKKNLKPYQIRDAHGISLPLAMKEIGIEPNVLPIVSDDLRKTKSAFSKLLATSDIAITTGGISVGKHDLFQEIAKSFGIKEIFYKISQKPGKPLYFGKMGSKLWFGLPGNPVSALVCYYIYIRPALLKIMNLPLPEWFQAKAGESFPTHPNRVQFLRGHYKNGMVTFAEKQGSHCLGGFAKANVLSKIPCSSKPGKMGNKLSCVRLF